MDDGLHAIAHQRAEELRACNCLEHDGMRPGTAEVLYSSTLMPNPVQSAVAKWMASPVHNGILSDRSYGSIGCAEAAQGDTHWLVCVLAAGPLPPQHAVQSAPRRSSSCRIRPSPLPPTDLRRQSRGAAGLSRPRARERRTARLAFVGLVIGVVASACAAESTPAASTSATAEPTASPSATAEPTPVPAPTAGAFPEELVAGLRTETDVPYTEPLPCGASDCAVPLDVLAPEDGDALPTIVLLPGGPGAFEDRRYLETLAAELAQRGAVVFLATYRSEATGDTTDAGLSDVRCAIRVARSRTGEFGGDPDRLVLAGHSFGSSLALETAANAEAETAGLPRG